MSYNPYFPSNYNPYIGVPGKESNPHGQLRSFYEPRVPVLIPTSADRGFIQQMSLPTNNILPGAISKIINPDQTPLLPNDE